ncbi:LuxR C-terminal-related transcriptional regulator [Streptomyces sp. NPDC006552]|uniref:helix-turn-helix transcriptional regulator n=1 Tax=Streptomyces sp. NPDC006552 TaxID=3157179 RepID=UPI00339F0A9E
MRVSLRTERSAIGHEDAWHCVAAAVGLAEAGASVVLLVEGCTGIGKTLLLDDAVRWARRRGLSAAHRADLDEYASAARATPAGDAPRLVAVDNVETLSPRAERNLWAAIGRAGGEPVVWMLAVRPGGTAERLFRHCPTIVTRTILRPLTPPQATDLAAKLMGFHAMPPHVAGLVTRANGDPQLITALARGLEEETAALGAAASDTPAAQGQLARVRQVVAGRLATLAPAAREALCRLAAEAEPGPDGSRWVPRSAELEPCLDEATTAGILLAGPTGALEFTSELLRAELARQAHAASAGAADPRCGPRPDTPAAGQEAARHIEELWRAGDAEAALRAGRDAVSAGTDGPPAATDGSTAEGSPAVAAVAASVADKLAATGQFDEAWETLARAPAGSGADETAFVRARLLLRSGRPAQAHRAARAVADGDQEHGPSPHRPAGQALSALIALRGGDLAAAAAHLDRCFAELGGAQAHPELPLYAWVRAQLVEARHGPRSAVALLNRPDAARDLYSRPALYLEEPGAAAWIVRQAQAVGVPALARNTLSATARLAAANDRTPAVVAVHRHAYGLVHADPGALRSAATGHACAWARGSAWEDLAVVSLRARSLSRDEWIQALENAFEAFGECGADRDAARVRQRLRTAGRHTAPVRGGRGGGTGWENLSEVERTIAHLAGAGLTNRQIAPRVYLSPHTVNYHLRKIYPVLGVGSRVELGSALEKVHA